MAQSQVYTAITGDTITAARWNTEFANIYNNGTDVAFPLTKAVSAGSFNIQSLADPALAQDAATKNYVDVLGPLLAVCEFRLTLTSGTPVTTGDVTAAGTLYCTPYKGNKIKLYDGTSWNTRSSAEFSLALTLTAGKPYDIFCYDNSGTPTLEALVWTNDTTRATALTLQNGVLVKTGATTRRYLGTIYSSGLNTTEDSYAKRYVWNYYNRVTRPMRVTESTDTWTYTTATIRQARATATNQLDCVIGYSEDVVSVWAGAIFTNTNAGVSGNVLIGLDSTTAMAAGCLALPGITEAASGWANPQAFWKGFPGVGRHYFPWLEYSAAAGTTTWQGDGGAPLTQQSGIHGEVIG